MVSRRQLIQGVLSGHRGQFSPPWSIAKAQFINLCTRCDDCINSCPQKILTRNEQGYPVVDYTLAGCTFCAECVTACTTGSLSMLDFIGAEPWNVKAVVTKFCVNHSGTLCRMCATGCAHNAIKFSLQAGGISLPEIDLDECNGCGECYRSCPKQAIDIKAL